MNTEFGATLQGLLENRGLTMRIVARASGRAYSTINQLLSGDVPPTEEILRDISAVLQMPLVDLLVIAGIPHATPAIPPPPYPGTPGINRLIHAASPLTTEQLGYLADVANTLHKQNDELRREFTT